MCQRKNTGPSESWNIAPDPQRASWEQVQALLASQEEASWGLQSAQPKAFPDPLSELQPRPELQQRLPLGPNGCTRLQISVSELGNSDGHKRFSACQVVAT